MKKLALVLALCATPASVASADPPQDAAVVDTPAVDAAPPPSSGSSRDVASGSSAETAIVVTVPPVPPVVTVPDPAEDPVGFLGALRAAWAKGWALAALIALAGLLEALGYFGSPPKGSTEGTPARVPSLAWFGKGRQAAVIGAALVVLLAIILALEGGTAWSAAIIAGAGALLKVWNPFKGASSATAAASS